MEEKERKKSKEIGDELQYLVERHDGVKLNRPTSADELAPSHGFDFFGV